MNEPRHHAPDTYVCTDPEHGELTRVICPCDAFDGYCHSCEDPRGVPSCMTLSDATWGPRMTAPRWMDLVRDRSVPLVGDDEVQALSAERSKVVVYGVDVPIVCDTATAISESGDHT